jgi:hypothetical protein
MTLSFFRPQRDQFTNQKPKQLNTNSTLKQNIEGVKFFSIKKYPATSGEVFLILILTG